MVDSSFKTQCPINTPMGTEAKIQAVKNVMAALGRKYRRTTIVVIKISKPTITIGSSDSLSLHMKRSLLATHLLFPKHVTVKVYARSVPSK